MPLEASMVACSYHSSYCEELRQEDCLSSHIWDYLGNNIMTLLTPNIYSVPKSQQTSKQTNHTWEPLLSMILCSIWHKVRTLLIRMIDFIIGPCNRLCKSRNRLLFLAPFCILLYEFLCWSSCSIGLVHSVVHTWFVHWADPCLQFSSLKPVAEREGSPGPRSQTVSRG